MQLHTTHTCMCVCMCVCGTINGDVKPGTPLTVKIAVLIISEFDPIRNYRFLLNRSPTTISESLPDLLTNQFVSVCGATQ